MLLTKETTTKTFKCISSSELKGNSQQFRTALQSIAKWNKRFALFQCKNLRKPDFQ